jgi:hypothetical protein
MDLKRIKQIRDHFEKLPIDELLNLWEQNDREEYSGEAFEAMKEVIEGHVLTLPRQKQHPDNNVIKSDTKQCAGEPMSEAGLKEDEINDAAECCMVSSENYKSVSVGDKYCPRCNAEYDQAMNFCGKCGVQLSVHSVKTANLTDEELEKIITEDFNNYPAGIVAAATKELEERGYKIDPEVIKEINEYLGVAALSDGKLIAIIENFWNYPTTVLDLAYQQLEKRKIKIEGRILDNGVTDGRAPGENHCKGN